MSSVKTTFANGKNPFKFDPATLKINVGKERPKSTYVRKPGKYVPLFSKMKIGDSITVPDAYRWRVQEALSNWIKKENKEGRSQSFANDPKPGMSTIYWVKK